MKRKRLISIVLMVFMFLSINLVGTDITRLIRGQKNYTVALAAAPRSSSGGFKSGSFKSFGGFSSGGFKSGSFFNSKKNNSWAGGNSWSWSSRSSRRSWLPISIPWNFGRSYGFSPLYFLFGSLGAILRLFIIVAVIYYIVKHLRRR
ncbi:MAG: hypothetical protein K0R09_1718 [Clostridiales bacterium]|nr:hypothetical protein [Clostridiales bacterium]